MKQKTKHYWIVDYLVSKFRHAILASPCRHKQETHEDFTDFMLTGTQGELWDFEKKWDEILSKDTLAVERGLYESQGI